MPSWVTHIVTANKVLERINIQKDEFIFGNIMPDILNGFNIKVEEPLSYYTTHFAKRIEVNGIELPIPDIERFKKEYKSLFNNSVVCGFYTHLVTDYFWNEYAYRNYFEVYDKEKRIVKLRYKNGEKKILTWNESVREKQKDFAVFAKKLQSNLKLNICVDANKILEDVREIKEITFTKKDIESTILYLKDIKESVTPNEDYKIFTKEELEKKLQECVEFIIQNLKE